MSSANCSKRKVHKSLTSRSFNLLFLILWLQQVLPRAKLPRAYFEKLHVLAEQRADRCIHDGVRGLL